MASQIELTYHGDGDFALSAADAWSVRIDPCLVVARDGQRVRLRRPEPSTYVVCSDSREGVAWDALELLEASDATLIAPASVCDTIDAERAVEPDRLVDLAPWERLRSGYLRITSFPIASPASGGLLGNLSRGAQTLTGNLTRPLSRMAQPLTQAAGVRNAPSLGGLLSSIPMLGDMVAAPLGFAGASSTSLGWVFELEHGTTVVHASTGLAGRPDADMLDDLASFTQADILVAAAEGDHVEGLIWATRALRPHTVLLYRHTDPYSADADRPALPIQRFIEALHEDAPDVDVEFLRPGDAYVFDDLPEADDDASA